MDEIAGAYHTFLRSRQGHRDFIAYYADEVMMQRELTPAELTWIVEQSLRTPTPIAAALFASDMFSNCMEAAKQVDAALPALAVIAEHWAETATAFMRRHFPNTRTAVLGRPYDVLGASRTVQSPAGRLSGDAVRMLRCTA